MVDEKVENSTEVDEKDCREKSILAQVGFSFFLTSNKYKNVLLTFVTIALFWHLATHLTNLLNYLFNLLLSTPKIVQSF